MVAELFHKHKKIVGNYLLLALFVVLFFVNLYNKALFYRPGGIHQWRQTDCLSITKNYYEEGMHFFEPKIHFLGAANMQGKAVSECPILNYSVAALWKLFGEHEFVYRLLEYLIFIGSMFVLFNTLFRRHQSLLLSFFSVGFIITSPLLVYYSFNFIADVPALSLSIICFCLFYDFYLERKTHYFYLALLAGTFAVLMKASALVPLSVLLFFSCADLVGLSGLFKTEKLFAKKLPVILVILASLTLIIAWYKYAIYYNNNNKNNIFLLTVLPVWELNEEEIISNLRSLFNIHFPVFLNRAMFFLFFVLVIYVAAHFKSLNTYLKYSFVFGGLFFISYLFFFFQVFNVHDYYLSNLMVFPVITLFCFCHIITQTTFFTNNTRFFVSIVALLIVFNAIYAAAVFRLRLVKDDHLVFWYPFTSQEEKNLADYLFWDYSNGIKKIENFRPTLRKHGITREQRVLSIPDQSINISLYFLDQKGLTIARHDVVKDSTVVEHFLETNFDFVVLSDTTLKKELSFKRASAQLEHFFSEGGVEVFKVKKSL